MIPRLRVAAGILEDADGRYLVSERLGDGPFHGMWEFPGGKIDDGESAVDALHRELYEELGVTDCTAAHFQSLSHEYPDRHVTIDFYLVSSWQKDPAGLEGQRLRWLAAHELDDAGLLPADLPVIEKLKQRASTRPAGT